MNKNIYPLTSNNMTTADLKTILEAAYGNQITIASVESRVNYLITAIVKKRFNASSEYFKSCTIEAEPYTINLEMTVDQAIKLKHAL
jgi:hypothetical protein